jgi:hypothetical protein
MVDSLRSLGLIPSVDPYLLNTANNPYSPVFVHANGGGGEVVGPGVLSVTGANAIVDWVFIELRDKTTNTIINSTRSALLQRDGDIVDMDGTSPVYFANTTPDNYYLVVKHRNHLGVMSAGLFNLTLTTTSVDFTNISASLFVRPSPNNNPNVVDAKTRILFGKRALYAGNCNISLTNAANRFLSYNVTTASDRTSLFTVTGGTGTVTGYSIFDVDMNGFARFNGLVPDRNVILANCFGSNLIIINEQIP